MRRCFNVVLPFVFRAETESRRSPPWGRDGSDSLPPKPPWSPSTHVSGEGGTSPISPPIGFRELAPCPPREGHGGVHRSLVLKRRKVAFSPSIKGLGQTASFLKRRQRRPPPLERIGVCLREFLSIYFGAGKSSRDPSCSHISFHFWFPEPNEENYKDLSIYSFSYSSAPLPSRRYVGLSEESPTKAKRGVSLPSSPISFSVLSPSPLPSQTI